MANKRLTPVQAIKQKCKEHCCCGDLNAWKNCPVVKCPLHPYRMGKRPKTLPFEEYTKKKADCSSNSENKQVLGEVSNE